MDDQQFARELCIEMDRLHLFIVRGWISPVIVDGRRVFRHIDLARAALIADLGNDMGVNDEGIDVVLDLIDQLYRLRFAFSTRIDALETESGVIRVRHLD